MERSGLIPMGGESADLRNHLEHPGLAEDVPAPFAEHPECAEHGEQVMICRSRPSERSAGAGGYEEKILRSAAGASQAMPSASQAEPPSIMSWLLVADCCPPNAPSNITPVPPMAKAQGTIVERRLGEL